MSSSPSYPIVRFAWSAEDAVAVTPQVEGPLELALQDGDLRVAYAAELDDPADGECRLPAGAVIVAPAVQLGGGRPHVLRVVAHSTAHRGAYVSVCVAGDPTRELLAPEAATLAAAAAAPTTSGGGVDEYATQVDFTPPSDGVYAVRIRLRGEPVAGATVAVLQRALLVEVQGGCHDDSGDEEETAAHAAPATQSVFPCVEPLRSPAPVLRGLAGAAVLTNAGEARRAVRVGAGHELVLRAVRRDVESALAGNKPAIDLRSLYGPAALWSRLLDARWRFRLNAAADDLPRDSYGTPVVADVGCDATYLDAQLHLLLLRFHNRVMDHFANANAQQGVSVHNDVLFERARRCVVTHWQWAVFYDTVLALVDREVFRDVCACGQRFVQAYSADDARAEPPAEYALALAHLPLFLGRSAYPLAGRGLHLPRAQSTLYVQGNLPPAPLDLCALFDPARCPAGGVDPYVPRDAPPAGAGAPADPQEGRVLECLDAADGRLAAGHALALRMGEAPLGEDELQSSDRTGVVRRLGISVRRLPLLTYVLKEAEVRGEAQHLTGVGARLLTETVRSFIWSAAPELCCLRNNWRPSLPRARSKTYTMSDIVTWTLRR